MNVHDHDVTRQYAVTLSLLFAFYIVDFFITHSIINHSSFQAEVNPIAHWLLMTFGTVWVLLAAKIIFFWFLFLTVGIVNAIGSAATKIRVVYYLWTLVVITFLVDIWSLHVLACFLRSTYA
jgi:hypothetical protein